MLMQLHLLLHQQRHERLGCIFALCLAIMNIFIYEGCFYQKYHLYHLKHLILKEFVRSKVYSLMW